jgi:hypothetical protein
VGEDRACARHNMAFAPWWAECSSERFQLTFKIPSGSSACLRRTFENIVLVEVKHPQFKLCRSARESQMVDHAVSAILRCRWSIRSWGFEGRSIVGVPPNGVELSGDRRFWRRLE